MAESPRGPMDQISAHLDRGWDLVSRGDLAGAALSAKKCLEIDEASAEAHHLLGYVRAAEGHPDEALDAYRQAIELDETFVEAMLNAAEILIDPVGDIPQALAMVDEALDFIESDDEVADAMLLKVDAYLQQGDAEAARRTLATVPDGPFESGGLEFLLGRAKFEVGDRDGAEPHLLRALEKDPGHPDARYYLGMLLEARGDTHGATIEFLRTREGDLATAPPPWAADPASFEATVGLAIRQLPPPLRDALDGALVVVTEVPGAEVVADGVDPRASALLDALGPEGTAPKIGRVFVYQRNVERAAGAEAHVQDEIAAALERELVAAFGGYAAVIAERDAALAAAADAEGTRAAGPDDEGSASS